MERKTRDKEMHHMTLGQKKKNDIVIKGVIKASGKL